MPDKVSRFVFINKKKFYMTKTRILMAIMAAMAGATACRAQTWQSAALRRNITHPQPMTGLVLWPDEARSRNDTYGKTIQLEIGRAHV